MISAILVLDSIITLLGVNIINIYDFSVLAIRLSINLISLLLLIKFMYAKSGRSKDFYFSYFAIGMTVFLLCFLLESVKLELGFALGLFAIFGIIRYRTDAIPIKEMTYLFVVIGISVINALAHKEMTYFELIIINGVIIGALWALEKVLSLKKEHSLTILYEKIENIHLDRESDLLDDLHKRTGLQIKRYEVSDIDFLRDAANITIYFEDNGNGKSRFGTDFKK
ncbi:MAG: hypothetical protein ACJA2S_003802 [Cyclobacteriaceae bacterium]|jgi:hypothetical protein